MQNGNPTSPTRQLTIAALFWMTIVVCPFMATQDACADDQSSNQAKAIELFEKHIRPTLLDQCIRCHGPKKQQGGLRLDSAKWLHKGGDSGAIINMDDLDDSILITAIRYADPALEMPPRGKLPDATIRAFEQWVRLGATDPRSTQETDEAHGPTTLSIEEGRQFWSFQPLTNPSPPSVKSNWPTSGIDHFIYKRLTRAGLEPNAPADRTNLIRRVYYDLIGLPPTSSEIEHFLNDSSTDAYEALVNRLLDSPQFGQRWGRHWLDVVRYAESSGGGRTLLFPSAWRYRDYVIESLNNDLPYNEFLRQQIAGDLLPSSDWQDKRRKMIATAFLLLGPTNYELQDKEVLEMDVIDEQIDTIGKSMLGMTIGCARCHDHKFDPIPAKDYYAMAGIFKSTNSLVHGNVSSWNKAGLPLPPDEEFKLKEHLHALDLQRQLIASVKKELKSLGVKDNKSNVSSPNIKSSQITGIVVDDKAAIKEGEWTKSTSVPRYVDGHYIHDASVGKGEKRVIFRPNLPHAGEYEVRVAYSPASNRSTQVPVTVHHADGMKTVRINQKEKPKIENLFVSLGKFRFEAGETEIIISNEGTRDGVVIVDAIALIENKAEIPPKLPTPDEVDIPANIAFIVPDPDSLAGIVVDDQEAKLVGSWKHSVHTPPFVGTSYIHDEKESKGQKSATFTPDLPHDGIYEIRVSHNTNVRRANNVPITVKHADGETVVHIDEGEEAPIDKLFRSLGKFRLTAGKSCSVTIHTEGTDGKYVIVDAVQFLPDETQAERRTAQIKVVRDRLKKLENDLKKMEASGPKRPEAMVAEDAESAGDIHIAIRGVVHNKGELVPRGVMQVAAKAGELEIPAGQSGRLEFANWIASNENPLTARVMVNRVWYWLMGRGLVGSVDNFGSMGDRPTHPELLDHLASEFIKENWSVKQLVRRIMLSQTYRQSTAGNAQAAKVDPSNRLLARMNRKRLRAEDFRDSLLFVGGNLDTALTGSNIKPGTKSEYGYTFESERRSVYVPVFRNTLPEFFEVFDFADPNIQRGERTTSTIASQALLLMNHPFVYRQCELAAKSLLDSDPTDDAAIEMAYIQVLGRSPTKTERQAAASFVEADKAGRLQRMTLLYQTLFQCVDFRYLN